MIKRIILLIVLLVLASVVFSLAKTFKHIPVTDIEDQTFGLGETKSVVPLSITFNKFVQDSRCPIDVQCIQAGAVNINVSFSVGSTTVTKNMSSDEVPQFFEGYKISIVGIEPARHSKKEIKSQDYKITFHIERGDIGAHIITESGGGSGTFFYITTNIKGTKPFFIGDRIAPQTIEKHGDLIFVNYADRKPDESFATAPSVGKTLRLRFDTKTKEFTNVYVNDILGFSIDIPNDFSISETSSEVKFTIPEDMYRGTNLSSDTNITVENSDCKQATGSDAAAGNRYELSTFVIRKTPCLAIKYFVHYGVFENYPEGSIKEFDRVGLLKIFDGIKNTIWLSTKM